MFTSKQHLETIFEYELLDSRPGFVSVLFKGKNAGDIFKNEGGGHRVQRVPPTEKRGRTHTSTVTIAVLEPLEFPEQELNMDEIHIREQRGSGPGGQHRNKTNSCIVATHKPTGISVKIDARSQYQSKRMALSILSSRIADINKKEILNLRDQDRKNQFGCGKRGDKIRTYRFQDDQVTDHRTGETWNLKSWLRGIW